MTSKPKLKIAVIGSGPAGLMAATRLSNDSNVEVQVFEKRKGLGRKLLIAGSSGLNISHHASLDDFSAVYSGWSQAEWKKMLGAFSPQDWIQFIEKELGLETFLGTSERYFVREMKASALLKRWTVLLQARGVRFHTQHELADFESNPQKVMLTFKDVPETFLFDRVALLMGGASWLGEEGLEPAWASIFRRKKIEVTFFQASNVGYTVDWSEAFLKEAEGKPLKKILFSSPRGSKLGELMITAYGLEGTPVYFYGTSGEVQIDLKPDLTLEQLEVKCQSVRENLSPIRRIKKVAGLSDPALALLFHHADEAAKKDLGQLLALVKAFPLVLKEPRPLSESISSKGGVALSEINERFELKKYPNLFCGGEMLDWDAPTGGFLIQASVSQGFLVGKAISESTRDSAD
jgi:uncharacterized flavoprotein (TIGR03862 family)